MIKKDEKLEALKQRMVKAEKRINKEWNEDGFISRGAKIQKGKALSALQEYCVEINVNWIDAY